MFYRASLRAEKSAIGKVKRFLCKIDTSASYREIVKEVIVQKAKTK
jgi:hypothetical protein